MVKFLLTFLIQIAYFKLCWLFKKKIKLLCFLLSFTVVTTSKWKSPDKKLLHKLLNEYGSKSIRPVRNSSDVVTVHFRVLIARLIDLVSTNHFRCFIWHPKSMAQISFFRRRVTDLFKMTSSSAPYPRANSCDVTSGHKIYFKERNQRPDFIPRSNGSLKQ